ncbi:malonyl-CoA:anthocyanidin 5-O-glucoside-6''-O-malonyltransferase-like [Iris pallida]|uniref:Malonyl-CoA:anthocyanidin 5-O-glucoside-6''-O-malonyltransferase-like n=1 Tax=Iris pallida TaxID=29817 RepID=A0AAX6EKR9_IRIPA|nr:malonyl-CoA:anthocyanidin 5-O-glucoside-6''-O-malonyltransferase-like [Iris pallida]
MSVDILNHAQVSLPSVPNKLPPPTKLSSFDAIWIGFPPVQRLLLYTDTRGGTDDFSVLVDCLKSSLSSTLLDFLPLAGKLTYVPSTGDVEIDYSDPGFSFDVAESDMDLQRLAADEVHDTESYLKLVPSVDMSELPFWPFAVQVTLFKCGGVAIGYAAHHTVVDGKGLWQFVEAWTATCRSAMSGKPRPEYRLPSYDRTAIKHPRSREETAREILHASSPNLPIVRSPTLNFVAGRHNLVRRTFVLDAPAIRSLKQRATQHYNGIVHNGNGIVHNGNGNGGNATRPPSTFLAIAAHSWSCFVRAKALDPDDDTVFSFMADCRNRLEPPVEEGYFGNCVKFMYVRALVREVTAEGGRACSKIGESIRGIGLEDPLADVDSWVADFAALPYARTTNVSASPRFRVYETDFGFGRPDRVELVSMNHEGEVAMVGGKEEGSVQVTAALNRDQMDAYAKLFLGGLHGN